MFVRLRQRDTLMRERLITTLLLVALSLLIDAPGMHAQDGRLRTRIIRRRADTSSESLRLPPDVRVTRDVAYGSDPLQRFDVYAPMHADSAPVIFMVHGGGWRRGDKAALGVVQNKVARWVPRGVIVISTNYRLLPSTAPLQQAQDVARALAYAQRNASQWGADAHKFILMGHSSGAHLVALLTAEPELARAQGALPWLGTVSLDNASLNVVQVMHGRHLPLYDYAFGASPSDWRAVSPFDQLHSAIVPFLAVCSSLRLDSCPQAQAFARKARSLGRRAEVLPEPLRHADVNAQLGPPSDYTRAVENFLRSLDPGVALPESVSWQKIFWPRSHSRTPIRLRQQGLFPGSPAAAPEPRSDGDFCSRRNYCCVSVYASAWARPIWP